MLPKFNKNEEREKEKGERESRGISATLLPKFVCPKMLAGQLKKSNCVMSLPKKEKKKKKIVLAIVAMPLPIM